MHSLRLGGPQGPGPAGSSLAPGQSLTFPQCRHLPSWRRRCTQWCRTKVGWRRRREYHYSEAWRGAALSVACTPQCMNVRRGLQEALCSSVCEGRAAGDFSPWPRGGGRGASQGRRARRHKRQAGPHLPSAGRASQAFPIETLSEPQPCISLGPRAASKGPSPWWHSGDTVEKSTQDTRGLLTHNYPGHLPHGCSWSLTHGRTAYSGNLSAEHCNAHPNVRTSFQGVRHLATFSRKVSLSHPHKAGIAPNRPGSPQNVRHLCSEALLHPCLLSTSQKDPFLPLSVPGMRDTGSFVSPSPTKRQHALLLPDFPLPSSAPSLGTCRHLILACTLVLAGPQRPLAHLWKLV